MNSLDWYLTSLKPQQADAFKTLDDWFNPDLNQFMDWNYQQGVTHHRKNINKFTRADHRENAKRPDEDPIHWRRQMARRLFGLRFAVTNASIPIDRLIKSLYPKEYPLFNHFWLLRNCEPCLGEWMASNRYLFKPPNPTGRPCMSRFCPWCWLRRVDVYIKACRTPVGYKLISRGSPRLELNGLGYQGLVNVTSFDYACATTDYKHPFLRESFGYLVQRAYKLFIHIRSGPADPYVLRLIAPLYRETPIDGNLTPQVGIRVGFIHTDTIPDEITATMAGFKALKNITVEDAIRWTYPFPIGWLESEYFPMVKLSLLTCFHKLAHHGIVRDPSSRIRYGNVYR